MLAEADILITGGTGSFGRALVRHLLGMANGPRRIIIFSRDELKQFEMQRELAWVRDEGPLRFFIGDIRDKDRLKRALNGVDYVVHAAAMKQVPACEYNPTEAINTNVLGAMNLIEAAIDVGVKRVIALSTDKACNPVNLYGATKLSAEKAFIHGNSLVGALDTRFSVVRYGNVIGSRGSVVPLFRKQAEEGGPITITDPNMTRFWITLPQAVDFVLMALGKMEGSEVFVPKLPTVPIMALANAVVPNLCADNIRYTGIRQGEKLHETLICEDEARGSIELSDHHVLLQKDFGEMGDHPAGWSYRSDTNDWRLGVREIEAMLAAAP